MIDQHPGRSLVLDMAEVTFLDSTGIGAIIAVRNRALAAGGTVKLVRLQGDPKRVVDLAGLDRILI